MFNDIDTNANKNFYNKNNKKSFKEIYENVNYIHDNIDKYFNDIFKKGKKEKKKKIENIKKEEDFE
jgi:hypothetical protein